MDNKSRFIAFAKAAALIIWGLVACIVAAGVWNAASENVRPDAFVCVSAGINLVVNIIAIFVVKSLIFKDDK